MTFGVKMALLFLATATIARSANLQELNRDLINAAKRGDRKAVEMLLGQGADPNAKPPKNSLNALGESVCGDQSEIVKILLDHGADPRPDGRSLLSYVVDGKHAALARLLVSRGLNANEPDSEGDTILMTTFRNSQHGPDDVTFLIELGADPNARSKRGLTPLMSAAGRLASDKQEQEKVEKDLRILIQAGARVNDRDISGATALYHAADDGPMIARIQD